MKFILFCVTLDLSDNVTEMLVAKNWNRPSRLCDGVATTLTLLPSEFEERLVCTPFINKQFSFKQLQIFSHHVKLWKFFFKTSFHKTTKAFLIEFPDFCKSEK